MCKRILFILSTFTLLIHPLSLSAQNSFSLSLDVNSTTGDQAATSINVSADEVVTIQIFGKDIQNANGLAVRFEYNATQIVYEGFETGDVLPNAQALTEQGTNPTFVEINIVSFGGQATVNSGLVGTIRFRTLAAFSGTSIRLVRADLGRGGQIESATLNLRVALQQALTSDFNGDGRVGFADFLAFADQFGSRRGDGRYEARYDLDSNGVIGFSDFLIFGNSFGKEVSSPTSGGEAMQVVIPDGNLRAVIEDSLGKARGTPITKAEMATLTRLEAPDANIRDLTGLEFATRLANLHLGRVEFSNSNSISNITPLSGLTNLDTLDLSYNIISDVSTLSGLTNLTYLNLRSNEISDVSVVSNLTNLTTLWLYSNSISDVSALSGLTSLEQLYLHDNSISDVSPLSGLTNLEVLWLDNNNISDISPLSGLTNLESLDLHNNSISDVSALSGLTSLKSLFLYNNSISDVSALSSLTYLEWLVLDYNFISDVSALSGLTSLDRLHLSYNVILDVSGLSDLTSLEWLDLSNNNISDLSPLSDLTSLEWLDLSNNNISDVSGLSGLTNLRTLALQHNTVSDLSPLPLSGMPNLRELWLAGNTFSDITPLSDLTNLTVLDLQSSSISDISLLASFTNLTHLYLYNNTISDIVPLAGLTNLEKLNLRRNAISDISPLVANTGLGSGDEVDVRNNPLNDTSIDRYIPYLQSRGVTVRFGASKPAVEEKERDIPLAVEEPVGDEGRKADDYIYRRQMEKKEEVISQKSNLLINAKM